MLALLSEYLDKEVPASQIAQIEPHLAERGRCLKFGTRFATLMRELVGELSAAESLDNAAAQRLRETLEAKPLKI